MVWKLRNDLEEIRSRTEFGFSCAQRFSWKLADTPVTYSKMLDSVATDINIPAINLSSGVFTASMRDVSIYSENCKLMTYKSFLNKLNTSQSGSYSISFSFYTADDAEDGANDVYLYRNNIKMMETLAPSETATNSNEKGRGKIFQTSGRTLYLQLKVNDSSWMYALPRDI